MDLREIRQLIKMLAGTDVAEIEVRNETKTVRITRQLLNKGEVGHFSPPILTYTQQPATHLLPPQMPSSGGAPSPVVAATEAVSTTAMTIQSPMVGTFYQANSPDAAPLVARGDIIKKGQVVCIIEAMKLMNEIESEHAGRIVSILKENASPVEYGEPLFILEPV